MKELGDYISLIIGFLLGIVGSFLTSNPKLQNRFSKLAKIFGVTHHYTRIGGAVTTVTFHFEIMNGYELPLTYYTLFLEFNTKEIKGNIVGATSLLEVMNPPAGVWYLMEGETSVHHRLKSHIASTDTALISQITNRKDLKYRLCLGTSRYGTIRSEWKELLVTTE